MRSFEITADSDDSEYDKNRKESGHIFNDKSKTRRHGVFKRRGSICADEEMSNQFFFVNMITSDHQDFLM